MKYFFFKPREKEGSFILSVFLCTAKMLLFVVLLIALAGGGLLAGLAKAWVGTCTDLDVSNVTEYSRTSFIYDRYGNLITEYKGSENRIDIPITDVSQDLINAVIAVEDARFFEHRGIDVKRIVGAFINNFKGGSTQGASTITCQVIKLTVLSSEQTYRRKVQEAYLALLLEEKMSKEEILEVYLNMVYMGGSSYGVELAARDYFGKTAKDLTLRECAALARVIRNPSRYNPRSNYYKRGTPQVIEDGADYVLRCMLEQGMISRSRYDKAMGERLTVLEASTAAGDAMYDNAYYVEYAVYDVVTKMLRKEQMEDTPANRRAMEQKFRNGGYYVYTCLDSDVQKAVQDTITTWKRYPKMRYSRDASTASALGGGEYMTLQQPQASCCVIDWHTGEIVAMVGGRNEPVVKKQLNRAYQMKMPTGSSIKPLSVYGPAFDMGLSPGTPVLNLPIPIAGWVSESGYPKNYSGGSWTGVVSMRTAMNKSYNYSAAQALINYAGIENSVTYLLKLGVDPDHILATGSGLALGSSGLSVLELASGFGTVANMGQYLEPYAFTAIYNSDGTPYIEIGSVQTTRRVFKQSTAWLLTDVLKGCVKSGTGTGSSANFDGMPIMGKTGTNSNNIGVTFAGASAYYACAVWIGSDNYKPLVTDATGGKYAAPLWSAVMSRVHKQTGNTQKREINDLSARDVGLVKVTVCGVSGLLATNACKNDINGYECLTDWYLDGTQPTAKCNMHMSVEICGISGKRATRACPSTYLQGVVYVPAGHPLRHAESLEDVQVYFKGASFTASRPQLPVCTACGG